jgi:hypothetical protein
MIAVGGGEKERGWRILQFYQDSGPQWAKKRICRIQRNITKKIFVL